MGQMQQQQKMNLAELFGIFKRKKIQMAILHELNDFDLPITEDSLR